MEHELLYKEEAYAIVGAALEVREILGIGFLEAVYQEALELELSAVGIPFVAQAELKLLYKRQSLRKAYTADFVCYDKIIVEIKALDSMTTRKDAQIPNYLKATGYRLGLLINFGSGGTLEWKRCIF